MFGVSQLQLSKPAGLGFRTIKRIELAEEPSGSVGAVLKLQTAFEKAGVEFIPADGDRGPGGASQARRQGQAQEGR
jgi:hypothetical protein